MHVEFIQGGVTYTHGDYDSDSDYSECTQEKFWLNSTVISKAKQHAHKLYCDETLTNSDFHNRPRAKKGTKRFQQFSSQVGSCPSPESSCLSVNNYCDDSHSSTESSDDPINQNLKALTEVIKKFNDQYMQQY